MKARIFITAARAIGAHAAIGREDALAAAAVRFCGGAHFGGSGSGIQ